MPATYSYPGVYLEEIPSGIRAIAGVSTSNTAFVDFFKYGPVDEAVRITSFNDFERTFGGLDPRSEASYAIQQYYLNGGQIAWVVRVVGGASANAATLNLQGDNPAVNVLVFTARSKGKWGNEVQVGIDYKTFDQINADGTANSSAKQFNVAVRQVTVSANGETQVLKSEVYRNLVMDEGDPQNIKDVINQASSLVKVDYAASNSARVRPLITGATTNIDIFEETGKPRSTAFKALGENGNQVGVDGDLPGSTGWQTSGVTSLKNGLNALDKIAPEIFNLLCIPAAANFTNDTNAVDVYSAAAKFCEDRRAFLIVDIPEAVDTRNEIVSLAQRLPNRNAAIYYPRLLINDPLRPGRSRNVGSSGAIAGIYARTDATRGVWKAPAGTEADLRGAAPALPLTDLENGALNPLGINVLRNFPVYGSVVWGARTLYGADQRASEWKYIPVRRMALYLQESLYQGLKWVVFEPNDEPLWSQIRLNVGAFMQGLFRQGAFQGTSPREAYFVKCDRDTTTQSDINLGIVNILVGFAPLKPAEFVVVKIQQMTGEITT